MIQKLRGSKQEGFTLIELMIVIAIIGILAAIAIPNFLAYRQKGYDGSAKADVKNAYTAAQAYFSETGWSAADMDLAKLDLGGFRGTANVTLEVIVPDMENLEMTSTHSEGAKVFTIDSTGAITEVLK